ncbi:hypothetical protein [Halovivax limisalsi]|nr:hypothetical protein [Halovivax limisalsi]
MGNAERSGDESDDEDASDEGAPEDRYGRYLDRLLDLLDLFT